MTAFLLLVFTSLCNINAPIATGTIQSYQKAQAQCVGYYIQCYNADPEKESDADENIIERCVNAKK